MREIKIKRLSLENFKCHEKLTVEPDGESAAVYGDNAAGKTSIYDGLCWLLFGKDSAGNGEKNLEIKPLDGDGKVKDRLAVTAVEAVLEVNGEELQLRRTLREVWSAKRGSGEVVFEGNTSEYYVDGVPCKKNGFQKKVAELVDEETFRLLTSVSYFASRLGWQERRNRLFALAGVMEDKELLKKEPRFEPLVKGMGRHCPDAYKKKLLAEKKQLTGAKSEIPARISECQKTVEDLSGVDFEDAGRKLEEVKGRKESIRERLLELEHGRAQEEKRMEIRQAKLELDALERESRVFRDSARAAAEKLRLESASLRQRKLRAEQALTREQAYLEGLEEKIARCREQWHRVYLECFAGGICESCGQMLPEEKLEGAKEVFEARKKRLLTELEERSGALREERVQTEARIAAGKEQTRQLEAEIRSKEREIGDGTDRNPEGYEEKKAETEARIHDLNRELEALREDSAEVRGKLQRQLEEADRELETLLDTVGREGVLEYARRREKQLRQEERKAAEALATIEKQLLLMEEFSRFKTRFTEERINGFFRIARFRLFREQANGGVEDRCDVVYEGVPYSSVNNGMRINLGIDIINTLSEFYGVRVPLFVDNAESVTRLEKCRSQMIRLVVAEGEKQLRLCRESERCPEQGVR